MNHFLVRDATVFQGEVYVGWVSVLGVYDEAEA